MPKTFAHRVLTQSVPASAPTCAVPSSATLSREMRSNSTRALAVPASSTLMARSTTSMDSLAPGSVPSLRSFRLRLLSSVLLFSPPSRSDELDESHVFKKDATARICTHPPPYSFYANIQIDFDGVLGFWGCIPLF